MFIKSVLSVYLSLSVAFQHGKERKKKKRKILEFFIRFETKYSRVFF